MRLTLANLRISQSHVLEINGLKIQSFMPLQLKNLRISGFHALDVNGLRISPLHANGLRHFMRAVYRNVHTCG